MLEIVLEWAAIVGIVLVVLVVVTATIVGIIKAFKDLRK